jgi:hypothetical protein
MKLNFAVFVFCVFLSPLSSAAKTILPDSCGDPHVSFHVHTEEGHAAPAPAEGKALLILAQDQEGKYESVRSATVRYGLDGSWVGADYGNSYFALAIDPGVHHLCANWQGEKDAEVSSFSAEAGKIYYFDFQIKVTTVGRGYLPPASPNGGGALMSRPQERGFVLKQLSDDEGQQRLKEWKVSTAKPNDLWQYSPPSEDQ